MRDKYYEEYFLNFFILGENTENKTVCLASSQSENEIQINNINKDEAIKLIKNQDRILRFLNLLNEKLPEKFETLFYEFTKNERCQK